MEPGNVARKTVQGAAWMGLTRLASTGLELGKMIVLARLLSEHDFGLMAISFVFIGGLRMLNYVGTGTALIYEKERITATANVTFWMNVILALLMGGLTLLAGPAFAAFYREPGVCAMIYVLGGATMIRALAITHQSLLEKNLDFKQSALVTTLPTIPATLLTIFLAARGYGAWSIIWGQMVSVALEVIAVWAVVPWRPSWSFDLRSARAVIEYGKHVFGAQLAYYGITNVDYALVGRLLGTNLVGQYSFGYEKALMPFKYVVSPVADVFYPALNRVREDPVALREGYLKIARLVGAVTLPLTVGMILLAPELVRVVFDPKWLPSVPVLQLTAVWTMALTFCVNAASVAYALGRPDLRLRYHTLELALLIPAILLAAREGIVAVGLVVMLAHLVGGLLLMNAVHRLIPVSGGTVFRAIWPSLSSTALMAGAILAGRTVAEGLLSPGLFLVAATGGGAVLYTASLLGLHPEMRGLMRVVWQHLRSQRGDEG